MEPTIASTLFDRFESDGGATPETLARDLADLLGARRASEGNHGVLGYGLPPLTGITSKSVADKKRVARIVREAIEAHEPRLANVRVTPIKSPEFTFTLEGDTVGETEEPVVLKVLSPMTGGGLGAQVVVLAGDGK